MKSHLLAGCSLFRCPSRNRSSSFQTLCPLPSLYPIHPKNRTEIRPMGKGILWKGQNSKWSNQQSACKTCENQDKGYVKWSECSLSAIRAKEGAHWKERMEKGVCWKGRQEKGRSLKGRNLRIVNLWDLFIFYVYDSRDERFTTAPCHSEWMLAEMEVGFIRILSN